MKVSPLALSLFFITVWLFRTNTDILFAEMKNGEKNEINCLDFDYTYTRYATAGKDLSVRIYDAGTNQVCMFIDECMHWA